MVTPAVGRVQAGAGAAREVVEQALDLDRNSARVLQLTAARLSAAQADVARLVDQPAVGSTPANSLQVAIAARVFAVNYQVSCRTMLAYSLDELAAAGARHSLSASGPVELSASSAAAAVVVAEANAIAAAAEERLAAEVHASTVRAASAAHDLAMAAAATVAQAAEDARLARSVADALAAVGVATAAAAAAADAQRRAEEVAAMVSAAASAASTQHEVHDAAHAERATAAAADLAVTSSHTRRSG